MSEAVDILEKVFLGAKARVQFLTEEFEKRDELIGERNREVDSMQKARWTLTEVQRMTQERFKERVETLVTMAMRSIFTERNFGFELVFEEKRNQMECRPVVYEIIKGVRQDLDDPEFDFGGGLVDVVSFALRIALWSLETPRSRPVIILDEPMKNMGAMISLGGQMLREVAHKLGFQLIIVTHDDELIEIADRAYHIEHDGTESHAVLTKGAP